MAAENDLGKDNIRSLVWRIAIPSMLGQFVSVLYSIVDRIYIGNIPQVGDLALAGVGVCGPVVTMVGSVASLIGVGGAPLVSIRMGEGNLKEARRVMSNCVLMLCLFSLVLVAGILPFRRPMLYLFGASDATYGYAEEYFTAYLSGTLFALAATGLNQLVICQGFAKVGMASVMLGAALNIVLDPLFIFTFDMGVRGAAIATVIGTVCACCMSIASCLHKDGFIYLGAVKSWVADRFNIRSICNVWSSSFVEQVCLRIGFLLFSMTVANLGTTEMAAHQIGANMMSMSFSFGDGLSVAAVTLIGQSLGRKRPDMAKIYGNVCQKLGLICAAVVSTVYVLFGRQIYRLYSGETVILDYGVIIMNILSVLLFFQILQVVQFGCLRGAGDTRFTAMVSLISVTIIRPGLSWLLCYPLEFGLIGAWLGTFGDQAVRFVLSFIRFHKGNWTKLKL